MQYTKAMVELIQEARRRVPSEQKPNIKLANPDVFLELASLYHNSQDTIFRTLVKEAFHLAGDPWPEKLIKPEPSNEGPKEQFITKIYRGQTVLEKREAYPTESNRADHAPNPQMVKPKRIYRGQVVY